jgi:diguanylate cyclase (GGDEF)-like protein
MKFVDIDRRLRTVNTKVIVAVSAVACVGLGWIGWYEWFKGNELSFSVFYIVPVLAVAWYAGRKSGISISVFAALTWLVGDLLRGHKYSMSLIPYINAVARTILFLTFSALVLIVRRFLSGETKLANEDFLTKISNGRAFFNYAGMELARLRRYKEPFTLAYFDVDNFKVINDNYGHNTGDALLHDLAYTIRKKIRPTDVVARMGGDEFAILLLETTPAHAKTIMAKLQKIMKNRMKQMNWHVTFSFGVVTFLKPPASVDDMIKKADDLMYLAKRKGKDAINYFVYR